MKLTWARLSTLTKLENGQTSDELVAEVHGPIELDLEAQIIYVGHMGIPLSQVRAFTKVAYEPCPECGESFSGPTATSAHRRFSHGVIGKGALKRAAKENKS